jgi:hypothetical protein
MIKKKVKVAEFCENIITFTFFGKIGSGEATFRSQPLSSRISGQSYPLECLYLVRSKYQAVD